MKIHLYVLLFTVVFIHHSKCTESNTNESVTTPPVPGSSQPPSVEVPSTIIQRASFRERLHQFQASILKNSNISTQDLTELSKLINADPFDVDVIQWKLDEFNLKVKFSDDEIKHFASLFLYAMHEIIKQKGSTVVTTTPTNGPTPSTNSETSEQQSTPSKSPKTEQKVPKPDASSDTQVSEVLCVSVEQCKSLASQALWDEALQKCNDANPGEVVGEDDLIQYFESVMKAFNNVMKVSDFESSLKVVIAEPLTVVKDTPPSDTADNEQTQKNGNGHKTENSSDQTAENGSDQNDKMKRGEDLGNSNGQVTVETSHSSVIEEILPPKEESDIDDITTCSPYIKLSEQKQVSVSMYIYIKNNNKECLDSDLNLALDGNSNKPSSFLTKALSRDDRKSDTVLCREFVELFKLVDLAGLTQRMCDEQVLHSVSHAPFCTAPLPSEDDLPSLVDVFTKDNLFKIAAAFQFLIQLHTKPVECVRVCGGSDNAFCNAFVNLTLFFVEQTRKDRRRPPPTQQATTSLSYRSLLKQVNTALMQPRTTLTDLEDIQGSLDSPRLLNNTLTQIFPMMTERHLAAITDNLEIVRFIVRKAIYRQRLHSHTTPGPTTKSIKNYQVLCNSVEECKSLANQALWAEALKKYVHANPREVVVEDDLIWDFESVMEEFNVTNVSDFESFLKVVIADPLTVVKDTPPNDTADNEQTQKNGSDQNDRKKENPSDQNDRKKENGIDQYGSWDTNEDSLGKWMFPIRIVTTRSEGYDSRQQHWRTEQRRNGGSTVWRMFKTLVVLVLVVGSVYVCIRYKKKIRDHAAPFLGNFR